MKFLLLSPKNRTVYNFRGDLVKAMIAKGCEVIVTGPDRTDVDKIEALGARFVEIPMNKTGTSISGDLKYRAALKKLMKAEKPDVTLGYTIKPVVYGAMAAHAAGVKNVNGMITGGGYTFTAKTAKAKALGGGGKIPVMPNHIVSQGYHRYVLRNFEGRLTTYTEPNHYVPDCHCPVCRKEREDKMKGIVNLATGEQMTL